MNRLYVLLLVSGIVIICQPSLAQAGSIKGAITIDEPSFNKLLPKFEVIVVKFDESYPYGDKHGAFRDFSEQLVDNPNVIVAQVKVKDSSRKENDEFAKKYGVEITELPAIRMFVKGQKEPIVFNSNEEWTEENLLRLVKVNSKVYLGLPGCLEKFDKLATKFMKSKKRDNVLKDVEKQAQSLEIKREKEIAKNYMKIMKKIASTGDSFVATEEARVKKLLVEGKMDTKKKAQLKERLNVLKSFDITEKKTEL